MATAVLVGTTFVATAPVGGAESSTGESTGSMMATQSIHNNSPYVLRRINEWKTEMTLWTEHAPEELGPGLFSDSVVVDTQVSPGHGIVQLVTYAIYDGPDYIATVVFATGIDCWRRTPVACLATKQWSNAWISGHRAAEYGPQIVGYKNYGGDNDFNSRFEVQKVQKGFTVRDRDGDDGPIESEVVSDGTATAPTDAEASGVTPNGVWSTMDSLFIQSGYSLKKIMNWNSEGTQLVGVPLDGEVIPGSTGRTMEAMNYETFHGPSLFVMYDVIDPTKARSDQYLGTVVMASALDCESPAKLGDITGCPTSNSKYAGGVAVMRGMIGQLDQDRIAYNIVGQQISSRVVAQPRP